MRGILGAKPDVIGRSITLDGAPKTVPPEPQSLRRSRAAGKATVFPDTSPARPSFSSAAVEQEQRIRFDCLGRVASPQLALRRFDRRPDRLRRVVG